MKKVRKNGIVGKTIKTVLSILLTIVLVVAMVMANTVLPGRYRIMNSVLGSYKDKNINNSKVDITNLDLQYNKSDYTKEEIAAKEDELAKKIAQEGTILLKNDDNLLPFKKDVTFSLFSANTTKTSIGAGLLGGGSSLKEVFDNSNVKINEKLWKFYSKGKGSDYGLAKGSANYGDSEDFRINECPLSELKNESGLLDSIKGTIPVYVLKRVAGEGRDMPRSMYNHADSIEDKKKSYLEPDSTELETLKYLNDNFKDVVLVVNSNAAIELDWLESFPNIKSVVYATDLLALPDVLTGAVNPSGRTVDTFAADALASPAAQNFGDYAYYNEDGTATKYNYISYAEGIYVGYRYYETRYEDAVLKQGNAGDYNYSKEVVYPFGYGLSYTTFEWTKKDVSWNGSTCTIKVDVKNTGNMAGKDIVEIFAQSPYTEYDKANGIEKSSVQLVGYSKTSELQPGASETVTITFDEEQLKVYDAQNSKTYVLDAGNYYFTAARNAHDAVNNILCAKGKTVADGMTAKGNAELVSVYVPDNTDVDATTYSKDTYSKTEITNQFDDAKGDITYLSRSDWQGTWPKHDGEASNVISTWGNEINGVDADGNPASYTFYKNIDADSLSKLDAFDSKSPIDKNSFKDKIVYGENNGLSLIEMRGLDYDNPLWDKLLNQLTAEEYYLMISQSGYGTEFLESINKPYCVDADSATGLVYGGTKKMFPNPMTLAQTWNVDLALEYGEMIGNEAILGGADGWYAPSMNIHRTPFSGRNGEYYSEDAFLSGMTAAKSTYGAASKGMYTFIKHFAFNEQENHRGDRDGQYGLVTWLNEQSAREIYLLPFEMAMKVGEVDLNYVVKNEDGTYSNATKKIRANQAVMTAFNRLGYTWAGGSYPLITGILRNEWAFDGFVLTDNADTSQYMDGYQMIEAGADAKLTYGEDKARFNFDKNDPATYHYGREAMHRMLYTVVNSKAMNGAMPGSIFKNSMHLVGKIRLAVNIICPILILLMVFTTVRRFRKKKDKVQK